MYVEKTSDAKEVFGIQRYCVWMTSCIWLLITTHHEILHWSLRSVLVSCAITFNGICYWTHVEDEKNVNFARAEEICSNKSSTPAHFPSERVYNAVVEDVRSKIPSGWSRVYVWTGVTINTNVSNYSSAMIAEPIAVWLADARYLSMMVPTDNKPNRVCDLLWKLSITFGMPYIAIVRESNVKIRKNCDNWHNWGKSKLSILAFYFRMNGMQLGR